MLKARVRNVLGVKAAEFDIRGLTLVAGRNGEGKSSLLEALACVALGTAAARGMTTKKAQTALLHEGEKVGSATLDWGTGLTRVVWPDGKVESTGEPAAQPFGSALGMGITRWSTLEAKQRSVEFAARAKVKPGPADIAKWLRGIDHEIAPETLATLWERIDLSGWDSVHATATEKSTKHKGAWEQVTRQRFGTAKADNWRPASLLPDEPYDAEVVAKDLAGAKEALTKLTVAGAVELERLEGLKAQGAKLDDARKAERIISAKRIEVLNAQTALTNERAKYLKEIGDLAHACPHCAAAVEVVLDTAGAGVAEIVKSDKAVMTRAQVLSHQAAAKDAKDAAASGKREVDRIEAELADAIREREMAERAQHEAERLEATVKDAPSTEALAQARLLVAKLEERLAAVKAMDEAGKIYAAWSKSQPLIKALAPEGVRAMKAREALREWNATMLTISAAGGLGPIVLTEDLTLELNERPYALLSESERWRCDAVMSMALAKTEGVRFILFDRLDVLVADARAGVFHALIALGIDAVIACSVVNNAASTLPALQKTGKGSVWWMEAGTLTPLPY